MNRSKFRVAAFLLLCIHSAIAQLQPRNLVKHWGTHAGLSQGVVNSIVQDDESLMWFATEDGLNRFDGYSFRIFRYDPDNKSSIADNFVQSVFKDPEGTLWVSSRKGLLEFDADHETFSLYSHDFKGRPHYTFNDVSFITQGSAGNLWIGWYGSGFASFDKKTRTFVPYTPETLPGLSNEKTVALMEDRFGLLWVATQEGALNVFRVSKGEVIGKLDHLTLGFQELSSNVQCLAEDRSGNVWIGTKRGLVVYKRHENKFFAFTDKKLAVSGANVFSLLADSNDNLWIGTQGRGLYQLDLRQSATRPLSDFIIVRIKSLSDFDISKRTIQSIYEDKDKNIWIGTFGEGVYLVSSRKENFIRIQKPVYENSAVSFISYYGICYDHEGNLWLGTDGNGIYKSDLYGNTLQHFSVEKNSGLRDNAILSAFCDSKGRLWFGSYSQGLFLYDRAMDSFINYRYQNAQQVKTGGNDVRVIFEDSKGNLWIGTNRGGLCLLNEQERSYANPPHFAGALRAGDIRSIAEDAQGNLWIGCYGDGVYSYAPATRKFQRHFNDPRTEEQLKNDIVFAVKADRNGNLWMGTGGGGICVFNPRKHTFKRYTEKDGLSNNTVYAVMTDHADNVWMSSNAGISKLDVSTGKFFNYGASDGLQEGQFHPGSALFNPVGGYMCMGGTQGLNVFFPDQVTDDLKQPQIMLTGLSLFNKPVHINDSADGSAVLTRVIHRTDNIILKHDQNVLTFEFVGLNYAYPEKNIYAYKLEGLDNDWNFVGNQRSATYRYLNPGSYVFKVKASNVENEWGDAFASVAVTIKPPFWMTPLAYFLYMLTTCAIAYVIIHFRAKQLKLRRRLKIAKRQRKHERHLVQQKLTFFTEISHEFKTPLTLMIGPLEEMMVKESAETAAGRKLRMVYRNAHKLLNLINKLLDYRKIENGKVILKVREDNIVSFVEEICATFRELANHKNIRFHFHADQPEIMLWFDREKIEMVLNNIISNSFKYIGKGNEIGVSVSRQVNDKFPQGRACIKIRDNGMGIPRKHLGNIFDWFYKGENYGAMSSGIGLSLARKLVHLHKGEVFVDSVEGNGSTFSIKIPLGHEHFRPEEIVASPATEHDTPAAFKAELLLHDEREDAHSKKGYKGILLIEDDDEIRGFLKEYFEKDYKIFEASNGSEALEVAAQHHPDLIISDVMMPEMDGIAFCRAIRSSVRTSHIPVILLTAKTGLSDHKEGIETGADAYITKPFSPEILRLTVHNLLQSRENVMRFYRNLFTADTQQPGAKNTNTLDENFLRTIYKKLIANLDKPEFNISELCDELSMSRSLVYKKVKMLTGLSPIEYIRSLRMQEAAKLLKTKQYKVFEVVYMVGFTDMKYFRRCFTKEFGYSPSDFIKQTEETSGQ